MQLNFFDKRSTRSPLSYVGGKRILYDRVMDLIPPGTKELVSPFSGAAGLELKVAASGIRVHCHDLHPPNAQFFTIFNGESDKVVERAREIFPIPREQFIAYSRNNGALWHAINCPYEKAAIYWLSTKMGFAGRGFTTSPATDMFLTLKPSYFAMEEWQDWRNPNFSYKEQDWEKTLAEFPNAVLYCDPPYVEKSQFYGFRGGQKEFDHLGFRDAIFSHNGPAMISYSPHALIDKLYAKFPIIRFTWRNSMGRNTPGKRVMQELLIVKDLPLPSWAANTV